VRDAYLNATINMIAPENNIHMVSCVLGDSMGEVDAFWDRISITYDAGIDYILGNDIRPLILQRLKDEDNLGRTVEFGCGTGYFTAALARISDRLTATDLSGRMLDIAQKKLRKYPHIAFQREDCQDSSFADESFDTAFLGLIFHLVDGPRTLNEMHRILKPGGRLIMAIPTVEGMSTANRYEGIQRMFRLFGTRTPPGSRRYSEKSLRLVIRSAGFDLLDMEWIDDPEHPTGFHCMYLRAVKAGVYCGTYPS
jgi:ubiquinone/menaquinone biosynthesis C-methylase UbiE